MRTFNDYLRGRFGERVQKVSLDAGFTCPNRDGSKAVGGCIYCNNDSFNFSPEGSVREQLQQGIERAKRKYHARKFMAYFQAFSNTYGSPEQLYDIYSTIYDFPELVAVSIGTRPDCVADDVLDMIQRFTKTHEVWLEYGLESSNDDSLRRMNRAHTFAEFEDAVMRTTGRGIHIAAHVIAGFPWETEEMMIQTAREIARLPIEGIKIHNLYISRETALEKMYERAPFALMTLEQYADIAAKMLRELPPKIVVMRLTAECPDELLIAPDWCNNKQQILDAINVRLNNSEGTGAAACSGDVDHGRQERLPLRK